MNSIADLSPTDLKRIPESALGRVEETPAPVTGAPPRSWGEGDLGVPSDKMARLSV